MIIGYDKRPDLDVDKKLDSLAENIQLAFNEKVSVSDLNLIKKDIADIKKSINTIINLLQQ